MWDVIFSLEFKKHNELKKTKKRDEYEIQLEFIDFITLAMIELVKDNCKNTNIKDLLKYLLKFYLNTT